MLGTAAKVGETFFAQLIRVLARLLTLRGPLERAAADSSLALWALAWQPSNRAVAVRVVVDPLVVLYRQGGEAAADDAGAVLSVLARMDAEAREAGPSIHFPHTHVIPAQLKDLRLDRGGYVPFYW